MLNQSFRESWRLCGHGLRSSAEVWLDVNVTAMTNLRQSRTHGARSSLPQRSEFHQRSSWIVHTQPTNSNYRKNGGLTGLSRAVLLFRGKVWTDSVGGILRTGRGLDSIGNVLTIHQLRGWILTLDAKPTTCKVNATAFCAKANATLRRKDFETHDDGWLCRIFVMFAWSSTYLYFFIKEKWI